MAARSIVGSMANIKDAFVSTTLVGTETVDAVVASGEIGIVLGGGVALHNSIDVEVLTQRLVDALKEVDYK